MKSKPIAPVYINYGQSIFLKTYTLFKEFLKTVPFEKLQFKDINDRFAGIIISPRNNSGIPWCNLTLALLYAHRKMPFKIILDDLNFLDPEWEDQLKPVEELVEYLCNNLKTTYLRTSTQADLALDDFDYKEIKKLAIINGIWNVRNIVPEEKLNQYIQLSYVTLEANAKKIKGLYSKNIFHHCIHQSLVNNNGGLHKWFGWKFGTRVSCLDMSKGRGLVGIKDVPGYHNDLPDIIENKFPNFLDSDENRQIAINEAIKEHELRKGGMDSRGFQVVSTAASDRPVKVDILFPLNILWDAASLGRNQYFDSPFYWLHETIDFILKNTNASIVVRQHPRERVFERYGTGKILGEYLLKQFGHHQRFKFISCNEKINTYLLIEKCKVVLPYTSTVGIEAALMGKKVILESSVYYKNQPFVIKASSKQDYFDKIKKAYEEFGTVHQTFTVSEGHDRGWLLYFLVNKCIGAFSDFGLDPLDFEKWTLKGFDLLSRDENLMTAVEALITGKPFPYLNGKKIINELKEKSKRIFDWPLEFNEEVNLKLDQIITLIYKNNYEQALRIMSDISKGDEIFLYAKAFTLAKLNRFEEALKALNELNSLKPKHQHSRFLKDELVKHNPNSLSVIESESIEKK